MRSLARNKQKIYYALYKGKTEIVDDYGNKTGEYDVSYDTPVEFDINVSAARGTADVDPFGINANYTKVMVTNDLSCPIDEYTALWIGITPTVMEGEVEVAVPHNYVCVKRAPSINSISFAIREVSVT